MTHHEKSEATPTSADWAIVVSRVFDSPREAVYEAWADPQKLAQWFAPEPMTVPKSEADVRPGGRYTFVMRDPDGTDYPSTGEYLEVVEPERIVFTDSIVEMPDSWVDMVNEARGQAKGTPVPDGIVTLTFEDLGGKTRLTYSALYDSKATADAYVKLQMIEGLEAGFDKLEKVLARTA